MNGAGILKIVGQIAGLAGLSLGVFLLLFKDFFRQKFLQRVGKDQSYALIRLFMWLTWTLALFLAFPLGSSPLTFIRRSNQCTIRKILPLTLSPAVIGEPFQ
jgi:hypothetical protein